VKSKLIKVRGSSTTQF
jgi:hypothetical protein